MNIKDLKQSFDYIFKAQLTPFIWGHAGVGKSSAVQQYAEANGYHFFPLFLGTQADIGDVLGLLTEVRDPKTGEVTAVKHASPKWFVDAIEYCNNNPKSGAVIFLDEFNRAHKDVVQGMFSFALTKRLHTIQAPPNLHVVAAGNPNIDGYMVTDINENALMSRFLHVKLEPTNDEFFDYAHESGADPLLVGFFKEQPQLISDHKGAFELPVKCDQRAIMRLARLVQTNPPDNLLEQMMFGIIGIERTVAFNKYLKKTEKPISGKEVLAGEKFDRIKSWGNPGNIMASLITITCDNLLEEIKLRDSKNKVLNEKEQHCLFEFINILPRENGYALMRKFFKNKSNIFMMFSDNSKYTNELVDYVNRARGEEEKGTNDNP